MILNPAEVAARFESLGGGGLNANGWVFGCEFGFFQRHHGVDPLGLLRWTSIAPVDLLRGLLCRFKGVEDEAAIEMREHTDWDWGITQRTYRMYLDHSGMRRTEISRDEAARRIARSLGRLRERFIEDLAVGEKLFVYRTYDHTLPESALEALSSVLRRRGRGTLCYVQAADADHPAFTAERRNESLIVGRIDWFAPQKGEMNYSGWEAVCRAMLQV